MPQLEIRPGGGQGLYVVVGNEISDPVNLEVLRIAGAIRRGIRRGVGDVVPGYATVYVEFDPTVWSFATLADEIQRSSSGFEAAAPPRVIRIPVTYGGEVGPDLEAVAGEIGLSVEAVIAAHSAPLYRVYFIGFTPGFPFLGGMDERIAVPRLARPRLRVARGSVGIAGQQTGIYPLDSPGGWRIIGRTMTVLYDPARPSSVLLHPGDQVKFEAVTGL